MTGTRAKNAMLSQKENLDRNFGASSSQEEEKVVHCVTNDSKSSTIVEGRGIRENELKSHDSISTCFHSSEILEDSLQDLHIDSTEEIQDNKSEEETDRKELPKIAVTKSVSIFPKTNFCSTSCLIRSTEEENKNTRKFNTESVMIVKDEEEPKEFLKKEFKKSEQYGNRKSHNDIKITYANNYVESYSDSSAFHEAVRKGNVKSVMMLITNGTVQNLDEPDWNVTGDPPLLVAATNHCLPVLSILLESGCDPTVRSPRGETALHRVILNGGPYHVYEFVEKLLNHGCPASVKEAGGGLTALHVLTRQLAHAQGSKGVQYDFEEAVKTLKLLAKSGSINAKDHQGRSALHILASSIYDHNRNAEVETLIRILLEAGADPALKNDRGETALHECLECGMHNTALVLIPFTPLGITSRYGETPLHVAARKNYAHIVARFLEDGEDPGVQDVGGNTPLHLASARGFHETISLLVTSPLAQLERTNSDGLTSLQIAAESGFADAVKLLLKAGADPSKMSHHCSSLLHHRHPDISDLIDQMTRRRQLTT